MSPHPVGKSFFSFVENRTWLDHLSLAVFLGRNKADQVKSSAIKFLAQSLMPYVAAPINPLDQ
jgi:hypothetical protein